MRYLAVMIFIFFIGCTICNEDREMCFDVQQDTITYYIDSLKHVTNCHDNDTLYFYSVIGQSNHVGTNQSTNLPAEYQGKIGALIYVPSKGEYDSLEYSVNNHYPNGSGFSTEMIIGEKLSGDKHVLLHKHAQSGTNMHTNWNVDVNSTGRAAKNTLMLALNKAKEISDSTGQYLKFSAICFRQGESDMTSNNPSDSVYVNYRDNMIKLFDYLLDNASTVTSIQDVNIVVSLIDSNFGPSIDVTNRDQVVNAQKEILNYNRVKTDFFKTDTLQIGGDGVHFNSKGMIDQGINFYHRIK